MFEASTMKIRRADLENPFMRANDIDDGHTADSNYFFRAINMRAVRAGVENGYMGVRDIDIGRIAD